jgi:uncharacterized membrane protein YbhN (UPF0104 family)
MTAVPAVVLTKAPAFAPARPRRMRYGQIAIRAIASLGCATVLLIVLPRVVGTHWGAVGHVLRSLSASDVLMLSGVWALGLVAYTLVQAAALPGLGHGRALVLNLAGSMVANAVPLGGIVSISVNLAMVRSWTLTTASYIRFAALTQLLNVLTKLALPAVALTMVCFTDLMPGPSLVWAAVGSVALLVVTATGIAAVVGADRAAVVAGGLIQAPVTVLWRLLRRSAAPDTRSAARELRSRIAELVRDGWRRMALGLLAYSALQFLLFALALRMVGSAAPLVALFAAFAVERAFTLVPITPGGVGIAETMCTLLLVALGADPVISAAGVLLYRAFAFFLEMPFGFVALAGWWARRGRRRMAVAHSA